MDYYSRFWGPEVISIVVELQGVLTCWSSTLPVLADSGPFHGLLLTVLGSQSDFHGCRTPRCAYVSVINTHIFGRFKSVPCTITQRFGDPERFPRLMNPGVRLCVRHQHSQFWPILTCFVDYNSLFLGPEAISIVVEPQGALMFRSLALTVLADSGPFIGLLLTILGSRSDFHSY